MFPQEFVNNIRTPVFLVNAAYDYWQVRVTKPNIRTLNFSTVCTCFCYNFYLLCY